MKFFLLLFACFVSLHASGLETEDASSTPLMCDPVAIPDPNFEQVLLDEGVDTDGVLNGQICRADAESVTRLFLFQKNISSLKGIEAFINITYLHCGYNNIDSLDVSQNTLLTTLICFGNNLTNLDVTNNLKLEILACDSNSINSLDVSRNTLLYSLGCSDNNLSELNLDNNPDLSYLACSENPIKGLKIINMQKLNNLICGGEIETLDLSNSPSLQFLQLRGANYMKEIDLSNNEKLVEIVLINTTISHLDLSKNPKILGVTVDDNSYLNTLNLKNSKPNGVIVRNTPELYCIDVDDVSYALSQEQNGSWSSDVQTNYGSDCRLLVPGPVENEACITYAFGPSAFLAMNWVNNSTLRIDKYEVQVSLNGSIIQYDVQKTLTNLTIPLPGVEYMWRVRPTKSDRGVWSNWIDGSQCPSLTRSSLSASSKGDVVNIFPNPVKNSDKVFIQTPEDIKSVSMFNLSGQVIYKESKNTKEIDIQDFDKGIYLIRINTLNDKVFTKRVVIE